MEKIEVTSMSSRGQVVIPQALREKLGLSPGEKFIAIGEDDMLILKKLEMPSFEGFDRLLKKTRAFVKKRGLTKTDVKEAIRKARGK